MARMAVKQRSKDGKAARTRARILEGALALFRSKGFDQTTMRDIASEAELSLGAAYYHFRSKDSLILAFYERVAAKRTAAVRERLATTEGLPERLRALFHEHFDVVGPDRALCAALVRSVADPGSPISVFAAETSDVRSRSLALCREAISVPAVPEHLRELGAQGLWVLDLGLMLYFVWDTSEDQVRTRNLIDDVIQTLVPLLPLLALPFAAPMIDSVRAMLERAGLSGGTFE